MTIVEAAEKLSVSIESIEWLIKFHRVIVDKAEESFFLRDDDIDYFYNYLIENGRLPGLPS